MTTADHAKQLYNCQNLNKLELGITDRCVNKIFSNSSVIPLSYF